MRIENLSVENLRDGIFCAAGKPGGEEMLGQLEAWLVGSMLRGRIALTDEGEVTGFVIYYPIQHAPFEIAGEGLYMVQCVHVKPSYQHTGIGKALVESALADARESGASGLAVEGYAPPRGIRREYLPGTFFQHLGFNPAGVRGFATLYYAPFDESTRAPRYLDPRFAPPRGRDRIRIDILDCSRCYLGISDRNVVTAVLEQYEKTDLEVVMHDQNSRAAILDKGMSLGVFIDGRLTFPGGPLSEEDVLEAIEIAQSARRYGIDR